MDKDFHEYTLDEIQEYLDKEKEKLGTKGSGCWKMLNLLKELGIEIKKMLGKVVHLIFSEYGHILFIVCVPLVLVGLLVAAMIHSTFYMSVYPYHLEKVVEYKNTGFPIVIEAIDKALEDDTITEWEMGKIREAYDKASKQQTIEKLKNK